MNRIHTECDQVNEVDGVTQGFCDSPKRSWDHCIFIMFMTGWSTCLVITSKSIYEVYSKRLRSIRGWWIDRSAQFVKVYKPSVFEKTATNVLNFNSSFICPRELELFNWRSISAFILNLLKVTFLFKALHNIGVHFQLSFIQMRCICHLFQRRSVL